MPELLSLADVEEAFSLSEAEGWNQTRADWRRLIELEPDGCFALRENGRLIGTVTTTTYADSLAWIGMMIVRGDRRRQGIGAMLMRAALGYLERRPIPTVKLDATPAGKPLYESLGFVAEVELERWQGTPTTRPRAKSPSQRVTRESLIRLDATAYGVDRARLIDALAATAAIPPLVIAEDAGAVAGFALARSGRLATYLGPIVASSAGDAEKLLDEALARLSGTEVCLDVNRSGHLTTSVITARGLEKHRVLVRMRYGEPNAAATSPMICASAGPEYG